MLNNINADVELHQCSCWITSIQMFSHIPTTVEVIWGFLLKFLPSCFFIPSTMVKISLINYSSVHFKLIIHTSCVEQYNCPNLTKTEKYLYGWWITSVLFLNNIDTINNNRVFQKYENIKIGVW